MRLGKSSLAALCLALSGCTGATSSSLADGAEANPANWPSSGGPVAITDERIDAQIDALLAKMSLEQKVGQLIQADIGAITPADLKEFPLGSILAGGNSGPYGNERAGAEDWYRLVSEFRKASSRPAANGVAIPILFGVDAVHGHNNLPGATIFPHNIGLGAAHDPDLIRRIGEATAAEIAGSGIEWTFAPTLAVPQDLRWGRSYEAYSQDPSLVAAYSSAMVLGLQGDVAPGERVGSNHVAATAKHFLADGGTLGGKDQGDARVSEDDLIKVHAQGYLAAIDARVLTVMASFSSWNGTKNHGNRSLLTDVLKGRLGFSGLVVGDWDGHGQVAGCTITDCVPALMAGVDLFMAPGSWKGLYKSMLAEARKGTIPMERIDDAARRVLRVKFKLGLMGDSLVDRRDFRMVGAPQHLALAREAAAKSLVLLKNNGSVLPVRPGARVLVAGPGADNMAMQAGGWTISWQGTDVTRSDFPNGQTVWQAISTAVSEAGGAATLSEDGRFKEKPDVAIVVFGETPYAETQGDVPTLDYQPAGATDLALLRRLKDQGIPVVSVFLSGRPMFTSPEINASDAFVAAWLPGSQGGGIADVLIARSDGKPRRDFTGRLPFAWPADARSPVIEPLFAVGYGLDYGQLKHLGNLPEDPREDIAKALNIENYFAAGSARSPWSLSIEDQGGKRPVSSGNATSPNGAIKARSVDVKAQEDGKAFAWSGPATLMIEGPLANMSKPLAAGKALTIEWRIDSRNKGPVTLAIDNGRLDLSTLLSRAPLGTLLKISIPLRCFTEGGADLTRVESPLRVTADRGFGLTLVSARLDKATANVDCP